MKLTSKWDLGSNIMVGDIKAEVKAIYFEVNGVKPIYTVSYWKEGTQISCAVYESDIKEAPEHSDHDR